MTTYSVFLPGEFHGQRNLTGYSPWGHNEWDMTEQLTHIHTHTNMVLKLIIKPQMTSSMIVPESKTLNHGRRRLRGESFNYSRPPYFLIPTFCNHL